MLLFSLARIRHSRTSDSFSSSHLSFIFELDVRSVLDYRQLIEIPHSLILKTIKLNLSRPRVSRYAEMPSFLFLTLSGCLWLSFYRVGAENVEPTTYAPLPASL